MANSLNLQVVAEGVETQKQWDFLHAHGADLVQGYYISKPLSGDAFMHFVSEEKSFCRIVPK